MCGNVGGGGGFNPHPGFFEFFFTPITDLSQFVIQKFKLHSNHIWDLKDENIQFSITWQVLEKSKSFNPISLQCLLCLSEATQILTKPNLATLNSRSETYGFCRHRKKYLLKNVKPLAFKGGALTYRYKD